MLDWLQNPPDFKNQLRDAQSATAPSERVSRLLALVQYRLDFLQTIQVNRAIDTLSAEFESQFKPLRLAILGSATVDHLLPAIRIAALRRGVYVEAYCGGFGQYRQEIMASSSALHRFAPDVVVFSLDAAQIASQIDIACPASQADEILRAAIAELRSLWRRARDTLKASVIQQTFLNVAEPLFGSHDRLVPGAPWRAIERLNEIVAEAVASDGVALLDVARASQRDGLDAWYDSVRYLQAKQEIAPHAAALYGDLLGRILAAQQGKSKKCLVLDLDNTLWGGIVGDDGVNGVVLGQGSGPGEAYLAVQRHAKQLKDRGIILAVCSKNDPKIAAEAFDTHPEMVLKKSDIAAFMANWDDKARNLEAIARQLNIGLDSLVFLDDNPVERARIREALPSVAVPELPDDVSGYVRRLADAGYFEAVAFTTEDRQRAEQYAQNAQRDALQSSMQSMEEFLQNLCMSVIYGTVTSVDLPRVVQLINKTNQFTPTTRRYSAEQVAGLRNTPGAVLLQFRLKDRFGDNGLVSAMVMLPVAGAVDKLEIDAWVMSCRVFGRQLEHEALNIAVETARERGVRELIATYVPTAKNAVTADLYKNFGFEPADLPSQPAGASRWVLKIDDYRASATFIQRENQTS